eukprot:GHRQ01016026.1.p1 GENE.GHRQ01016026.1~~GHRQ01016026.1.p1  ORF type:complete len:103 (+),score=5.88 GHRQ01016026.1:492-800(+)
MLADGSCCSACGSAGDCGRLGCRMALGVSCAAFVLHWQLWVLVSLLRPGVEASSRNGLVRQPRFYLGFGTAFTWFVMLQDKETGICSMGRPMLHGVRGFTGP